MRREWSQKPSSLELGFWLARSLLYAGVVQQTTHSKDTMTTVTNLPAAKKRPPSSPPPVAALVDIVVADLKRDPRCK
ncbi:MAG TPA: hypothetical protein VJV79_30095 [Polyangiaceae bacterium]|nr:hypothetical protein [Polyangiaceae bacterium]